MKLSKKTVKRIIRQKIIDCTSESDYNKYEWKNFRDVTNLFECDLDIVYSMLDDFEIFDVIEVGFLNDNDFINRLCKNFRVIKEYAIYDYPVEKYGNEVMEELKIYFLERM